MQSSYTISGDFLPARILEYRPHLHLGHLSLLGQLRSWGSSPCHLSFILGSEKPLSWNWLLSLRRMGREEMKGWTVGLI